MTGAGAFRSALRIGHGFDLTLCAALALLAAGAGRVGTSTARGALLDLGPNDAEYVRGFRADWEREGRTRFHWTTQAANVSLPLHVAGEDARVRLRARRHFVEPAQIRLFVEGRAVHAFEIRADPKVAYRVEDVALPPLEGRHPFVLSIEASGDEGRGLGVALDWIEIEAGPRTRIRLPSAGYVRLALVVAVAYAAVRLAGGARMLAAGHAALLVVGAWVGGARDPLALERVLRLGAPTYAAIGLVAVLLTRLRATSGAIRLEGKAGGALALLVLVALAVRLTILLHPRFYYPDVRVHALFALQLARRGFVEFLSDFTANQFRFSLGLQQVDGHWYAFPYPPFFYMLAAPLVRSLEYRPEAAVSLTAAAINSLECLAVFALARHLGLGTRHAIAGAAVLPLLPIFLARLSLAYFPALVGHAFDCVALVYLVARHRELPARDVVVRLGALLALALLTYTQGLLNFAVLLGQYLLLDVAFDRSAAGRRRQLGLVAAGLLAGLWSAAFYVRYLPTLEAMWEGRPVAEERIVLELFERRARAAQEEPAPDDDDPYSGPTFDPLRGITKAASRLRIFYGPFAVLVIAATCWLALRLEGSLARLVWAWALTYLTLNLASGGLPGPNLVRYNKDLEIVAPLFCVALGAAVVELWVSRRRALRVVAFAGSAAWLAFGASRAYTYLTEKFLLER